MEDLIQSAPNIKGWKFTALKPASAIQDVNIRMNDYTFGSKNMSFYYTEYPAYPDEIDITIIHDDLNEKNKSAITDGTFIFLDNYLGELNFATTIDHVSVIGRNTVHKELVPIEKLKDFLIWRQKEFVEKYEGIRYDTENDAYASLEATLQNGNPMIAVINTDLLNWESKASHPWILDIEVKYDGVTTNGMPDNKTYEFLNDIENEIMIELKDSEGYLNVGRETADSKRNIYFACKDFRKPSKVLYKIQQAYKGRIEIDYDIYKDKYWRSFNRFVSH